MVERGFSLVEFTVVLLLVSLLLGGLLGPLATQVDRRRVAQTETLLQTAREALLGYAAVNGAFPCPTDRLDPSRADYGTANPALCDQEGFLPWTTLGIGTVDAWGNPVRSAAADPATGFIRYRADRNFDMQAPPSLTTTPGDNFSVQDANGNVLTGAGSGRAILVLYSTGPDGLANAGNGASVIYTGGPRMANCAAAVCGSAANEGFDDMLVWISRPEFFNFLIKAGRLP